MIELRNVHKSFNTKKVLQGLDLVVEEQRTTVIIGKSGTGKSVLLKHIVGLIPPDEGAVFVDGKNIQELDRKELFEVRKNIGMLFQGGALFDSMTVAENISLPLVEHTRLSTLEIESKVAELLEMIGMPGVQNLKPAELSGGMKKRVGLARAIALEPRYILYDEPTTGLDPVMSASIDALIIRLKDELGFTSIVVTHDMKSVYTVADEIIMLDEGTQKFRGTSTELRASSDPVVREFIHRREGD